MLRLVYICVGHCQVVSTSINQQITKSLEGIVKKEVRSCEGRGHYAPLMHVSYNRFKMQFLLP